MDRFIGRDAESRRKTARSAFADGLAKALGQAACRMTDGEIAVAGAGATQLPPQRVCRTPDGDWLPA